MKEQGAELNPPRCVADNAACGVPLCHSWTPSLLDNMYFTSLAVQYIWLGLP